jgi:ABC-type branched-subunit amino acid transport system substrate-binding protein
MAGLCFEKPSLHPLINREVGMTRGDRLESLELSTVELVATPSVTNRAARSIERLLRYAASTACGGILLLSVANVASAQKKYDPGANDTEIRIGNTSSYSGPASAYGVWGKTFAAYFKMVNDQGGVNGRKINFFSYDDAYNPAKSVEQARKLVEGDEVLAMFGTVGTPPSLAMQKYLHQKGIPQLFVASGASRWDDPKNFPWTTGWQPNYRSEARVYARYIMDKYPGKTVGILYQNDDFGRDFLRGFNDVFGANKPKIVVAELPFEATAPTVDSQIAELKAANPDIFINTAGQKAAAQAIRKIGEMGWKPVQFMTNLSISLNAVIKPAGLEHAQGIISTAYMKDANDPQWKDDAGLKEWRTFMSKYMPEADQGDSLYMFGYGAAKAMVQVLKQCGDELTRANVMKQAANLDMEVETLLPGIKVKTTPTDFSPIDQLQLIRLKGDSWELFGSIIDGG